MLPEPDNPVQNCPNSYASLHVDPEVDPVVSNGLMPAAGELMMLIRLLIMPSVEHAVQIIGVNLCSFVLRPRGSMVLQGSHTMNEPGIL